MMLLSVVIAVAWLPAILVTWAVLCYTRARSNASTILNLSDAEYLIVQTQLEGYQNHTPTLPGTLCLDAATQYTSPRTLRPVLIGSKMRPTSFAIDTASLHRMSSIKIEWFSPNFVNADHTRRTSLQNSLKVRLGKTCHESCSSKSLPNTPMTLERLLSPISEDIPQLDLDGIPLPLTNHSNLPAVTPSKPMHGSYICSRPPAKVRVPRVLCKRVSQVAERAKGDVWDYDHHAVVFPRVRSRLVQTVVSGEFGHNTHVGTRRISTDKMMMSWMVERDRATSHHAPSGSTFPKRQN